MEFLLISALWILFVVIAILLTVFIKNDTLFTILAITIGLLFAIVAYEVDQLLFQHNIKQKEIVIIASATDHNLTSVIYIDSKGDTVAQDYLTYQQLCNLH